jgi:hypothetical protein
MPREKLILLLTQAFERAADRLRTGGHDDPWPDDLWPQEVVRLLGERSRAIIASLGGEGIDHEKPPRNAVSWFCRMLSPQSLRRDHGRDHPTHPSNRENLLLLVAAGIFRPI